MRRLVTGITLAAVLFTGLLVAEHRAVPATIKTQSIAAKTFSLPALPTSPKLTAISPTLTGLKSQAAPSASASLAPTQFFPIVGPTCAALLIERAALLAGPQGPATDTSLSINATLLAIFHCIPISGV